MIRRKSQKVLNRKTGFEQFEERLVLTANSIDFDYAETSSEIDSVELTTLYDSTGADAEYFQEQYGFDGSGQTIAVIDTGIAWDHYALGGGFGAGQHVVGGWDFAENDNNPYDDGPAGFHGTHVSGIIGSTDSNHLGIASGADLVSLRVFDDSGHSSFEWVEDALQWVHEHRGDFANPITTVNLSMGTAFNTQDSPDWSILEDEFARLKADGMFISVAAGNAFSQFNESGLSFPGASSHVVPVASHDTSGNFSDFSQRNDRVLVAPGSNIESTVPDHLFAGTQAGQFMSASGTSMAAPFVAGGSALLRQAYQFMGMEEVTQEQLFNRFRETADQFFDSATYATYHRINLQAAIDSIVTDMHAAQTENATRLGTIAESGSVTGRIGKSSDVDAFQFTAGRTGKATLTIDASNQLVDDWAVNGIGYEIVGNEVSFHVDAGRQYAFALSTRSGIGHYEIEIKVADELQSTDWGTVSQNEFNAQIDGSSWFKLNASQNGLLTIGAALSESHQLRLDVYDHEMNQIGSTHGIGQLRFDFQSSQGGNYYVKASGIGGVEFQVTNSVSLNDGLLAITGTSGNDEITVLAGDRFVVFVNGLRYQLDDVVNEIAIQGGHGYDQISFAGDNHDDRLQIDVGGMQLVSETYTALAHSFESISVTSGGGRDTALMTDSAGPDYFEANYQIARLRGVGYLNEVAGYARVEATAHGDGDRARIFGSAGNDHFVGRQFRSTLQGSGSEIIASRFDSVIAKAGDAGDDTAELFDSTANDLLVYRPWAAEMWGNNAHYKAHGFDSMHAYADQGNDRVVFYDSVEVDTYTVQKNNSSMRAGHYENHANGFEESIGRSIRGKDDIAMLHGTTGNDSAYGYSTHSIMASANYRARAERFSYVVMLAGQGGHDIAILHGTHASESLRSSGRDVMIEGSGFQNRAVGFERTTVNAHGGFDMAVVGGIRSSNSILGLGSVFDAALDDLDLIGIDFDYLQLQSEEHESGQFDFIAVDFLYDLFGEWNDV